MGNNCFQSTPYQKYESFFDEIKITDLKDHWQTVKIFKIKKIFDACAIDHLDYNNYSILDFQGFRKIFPELQSYPIKAMQKFYQMFDFENDGHLDWNSFLSAITVCYFGSERTLALIMFIMFDTSLEMSLNYQQLKFLLENNSEYLLAKDSQNQYQVDEVCDLLASQTQGIQINYWLKASQKYINFNKFRQKFNIFPEQQLQKELVKSFYEWNEIYCEEQQRFVGYLVDLKWFQNWRTYILYNYNINIQIYNNNGNRTTIRSVKTCKKTMKKIVDHEINLSQKNQTNNQNSLDALLQKTEKIPKEKVKITIETLNIDCVNNHLGERPREMTNTQLQGQFQQVLRPELTQNMDYIVVSEKVWNYLKNIYHGHPEFRRTGFDAIELYPRLVKVYFSLFKEQIDYSTEVIREVSSYLRVDELLTRSCDIKAEELDTKVVYYKTVEMKKWGLLQSLQYLFTELSHEIIIFMVCLPKEDKEVFQRSHLKVPRNPSQINLGDQIICKRMNDVQKNAVFMGKSIEGKYIIHFVGQSYSKNICLMENELLKQCKLSSRLSHIESQKKCHVDLVGLPSGFRLSYMNSIFLQLFHIKELKQCLLMLNIKEQQTFISCLSQMFTFLKKNVKIDIIDIKNIIKIYLNKYTQFEVTMCYEVLDQICHKISEDFQAASLPNLIKKFQIQLEKTTTCKHCKKVNTDKSKAFTLKVPFVQQKQRVYDIVWISNDIKSNDASRHRVVITNEKATIGDFMDQMQEQMGIKNKAYMLVEISGNDIVKNYHGVSKLSTLESLKLRQTDKLCALELLTDLSTFVYNHFNNRQIIDEDDIKKDQLIDCRNGQKGWIIGKVLEIQYLPYIQNCLVKVLHKFNTNQTWEISYDVYENNIARYPLKSYKTAEHYHVRVHQRIFNEASNNMQLINFPLIFALPSWMRLKEFSFLVYLQIRKFISKDFQFQNDINQEKAQRKGYKSVKNESFKDYKKGAKFPYELRFSDYEGRCLICFKFLKSTVFKGENDTFCPGCQISQTEPISWQFKPADLIVCIDWQGFDRFAQQPIKDSKKIKLSASEPYKSQTTVQECIKFMKEQRIVIQQQLCCNILSQKQIKHKILKNSDILVIQLERIIEELDGFKRILKRQVKFNPTLKMEGTVYKLIGITSIEGECFNLKYKTYIFKSDDEWYEYDGKLVRIVNKKYMQKVCALVLFYNKSVKDGK